MAGSISPIHPTGSKGTRSLLSESSIFNGIYRLSPAGELELLSRDQSRPNGIALSPDETTLYVANSDAIQKFWMAYDLSADGASNPARLLRCQRPRLPQGLRTG